MELITAKTIATLIVIIVTKLIPTIIIVMIILILVRETGNKRINKSLNKTKPNILKNNIIRLPDISEYNRSEYYEETGIEYKDMIADAGRAGEYETYKAIKDLPGYKKFVFNTYLEKEDGTTTEIDIIMIHEKAIFVIECKNFNSYITGDEKRKQWCASYAGGTEKHFFPNPIIQNSNHIRYLKQKLNGFNNIYSIIAFGNGAKIENIKKTSDSIKIIKTNEIDDIIKSIINSKYTTMTQERIDGIYNSLKKISGKYVSDEIKEKHIQNIKGNIEDEKIKENKEIKEDVNNKQEIVLSEKEKELIKEYRKLNESDKKEEFERIKKIANF